MTCRLVVFGSRECVPPEVVRAFIYALPSDVVVITGGARGVDMVATEAAMERWSRGELAGVEIYSALWETYGRGAGPDRNARMAKLADIGVGFRVFGESRGTDDMTSRLVLAGKWVGVAIPPRWEWRGLLEEMSSYAEQEGR